MSESLPDWLENTWQRLVETRRQGRFPHALLIVGPGGVGKRLLANRLAAWLMCETPEADAPCGSCAACGWTSAGSHPDLIALEPEETGKAIKVDQVRSLGQELAMTSHAGQYKVAIIQPADAMNVNAANSLLKTLEEPTPDTLLILVSASPGRLPATIRSRCQQLAVTTPTLAQASPWLAARGVAAADNERLWAIARGAPLNVLALRDSSVPELRDQVLETLAAIADARLDPLKAAADWSGDVARATLLLEAWRGWLEDLIRWQQAGLIPQENTVVQKLQRIVETVDCSALFGILDRIDALSINLGSGLNRQLQLEDILITWASLSGPVGPRANLAGR